MSFGLNIFNETVSPFAYHIHDTTEATSVGTGALIVDGGTSIAKNLWVGGVIRTTSLENSTSVSTGAIVSDGGLGVALDSNFGGDMDLNSNLINNVLDPVSAQDAATKAYVDAQYTGGDGIDVTSGVISADLKANGGLVIESAKIAVDLGASSITGTLAVSDGGTGATTLASNSVLTGTGSSAITAEGNLTFDGTDLTLGTGNVAFSSTKGLAWATNASVTFDGTDLTIHSDGDLTVTSGADIELTATTDVLIPANVGLVFGTGEKIEGDSTDLTVTSGGAINLTAVTDIVVPANVGVTFGSGEKIEGDNTDLTVTSGGAINLTAVTDIVVPANVGVTFGTGEKIEGDSTDLTVTSGGAINLTAVTDIVVPANVGVTFGTGEKIEGDSTDLTVTSGGAINLTAVTDIVVPANVGVTFGSGEKIEGDNTDLTVTSGGDINLTATTTNVSGGITLIDDQNIVFGTGSDIAVGYNSTKDALDIQIGTSKFHVRDSTAASNDPQTDFQFSSSNPELTLFGSHSITAGTEIGAYCGGGGGTGGLFQCGGKLSFINNTGNSWGVGGSRSQFIAADLEIMLSGDSNSLRLSEGSVVPRTVARFTKEANFEIDSSAGRPTAGLGGSGDSTLTNGFHQYKVSFVSASGDTAPGECGRVNVTDSSTQTVDLSDIDIGPSGTTQRKIFRTDVAENSGNYKLLTTIADNTTTTFNDNIADASLGAAPLARSTADLYTFKVDNTNQKVEILGNLGVGITPTVPLHVYENTTNTATAGVIIEQDSTGDSKLEFLLTGGQAYSLGIDNTVSDNFVLSRGATLGTTNAFELFTDGQIHIDATNTAAAGNGAMEISTVNTSGSTSLSSFKLGATITPSAVAASTHTNIDVSALTVLPNATGTITACYGNNQVLTLATGNAGQTVSTAATLRLSDVSNGSSSTVTDQYSLFVDSGLVRLDGDGTDIMELPADATDPTSGGGAATGRIPVKIGGSTVYLAYY